MSALDLHQHSWDTQLITTLAAALGAFLVANIGTQSASLPLTVVGALAGMALSMFVPGYYVLAPVAGAVVGASWPEGQSHRALPRESACGRRSCCSRFTMLTAFSLAFWTFLAVVLLQHGTINVGDPPTKVKVGEYVREHWSEWKNLIGEINAHLGANNQTWWDFASELSERVMSNDDKHFRTLELEPGASWDDVKAQYKRMARKYHPDKVRGSEEEKAAAAQKFMDIKEAYEALALSLGQSRKAQAQADEEAEGRRAGFAARKSRGQRAPFEDTGHSSKFRPRKRRSRPKSEL